MLPKRAKNLAKATVKAGTATVTAIVKPNPLSAAKAIWSTGAALTSVLSKTVDERNEELEAILGELLEMNAADDGFAAAIGAYAERHETFTEVIFATVSKYRNRISPVIGRSLAALLREYSQTDALPDSFFHGFVDLLVSLSEDEYHDLTAVMARVSSALKKRPGHEQERITLEIAGRDDPLRPPFVITAQHGRQGERRPIPGEYKQGRLRDLWYRLARAGLAQGGMENADLPAIGLEHGKIDRMHRLLPSLRRGRK